MVGIIVMSNVIGTYLSNKEQLEFLDRFGRTQVVSMEWNSRAYRASSSTPREA